jgi:hypothetical protein
VKLACVLLASQLLRHSSYLKEQETGWSADNQQYYYEYNYSWVRSDSYSTLATTSYASYYPTITPFHHQYNQFIMHNTLWTRFTSYHFAHSVIRNLIALLFASLLNYGRYATFQLMAARPSVEHIWICLFDGGEHLLSHLAFPISWDSQESWFCLPQGERGKRAGMLRQLSVRGLAALVDDQA